MPRRGRIPAKYMQVLTLLKPCRGYENGKTIDEIAKKIYGNRSFESKAKARQLIGGARRAMRRYGSNVDIYSIKPVGMPERRYCHLSTVTEYTKAIHDFQEHIEGTQKTEKELRRRRETVEERAKLEEARKKRAETRAAKKKKP